MRRVLRNILLISTFSFFLNNVFGQNLVPNFSFEKISNCPSDRGQVSFANPWYSPNGKTTDLINACNENGIAGVPVNTWGQQLPYNGNSMAGLRTYLAEGDEVEANYREYLAVRLTQPLNAGEQYYLGFKLSPGENNLYYSDDIGMYVSQGIVPAKPLISVVPTIGINNPFFNSFDNWYTIEGEFIAVGGEEYIVIGNFLNDENTTLVERDNNTNRPASAYYFIDDVEVESCKARLPQKIINTSKTIICPGENVTLSLNRQASDSVNFSWWDGSSSAQKVVTEPGIYYVNVEYFNGCSTIDSIEINHSGIAAKLGEDTILCPGTNYTLSVEERENGVYLWNDGSTSNELIANIPGEYYVETRLGDCIDRDTIVISYESLPPLTGFDTIVCNQSTLTIGEELLYSANYQWSNSDTVPQIEVSETGIYIVDIQTSCFLIKKEYYIIFEECNCNLSIPNAVSANNDGINDDFLITFPRGLNDIDLKIYNRWGELVEHQFFEQTPPVNNISSKLLESGIYFYEVIYSCIENRERQMQRKNGYIKVFN